MRDEKSLIVAEVCRELEPILTSVVSEAISKAIATGQCSPETCKQRCGLTHNEHYESHRRINDFFGDLSDISRNVRSVIVKTLIVFLIGAMAIGFGAKIKQVIQP